MIDPVYFLTWTTYGTWLPGDRRGWVNRHRTHGEVVESPCPPLEESAKRLMGQGAVVLPGGLRRVVKSAIRRTCAYCGWVVHALEVRSNHVHVVLSAPDQAPGEVMRILKAYASRALSHAPHQGRRGHWWTRQGSKRVLRTDEALQAAVRYVRSQETSWMKDA